ncbi:Hypothetical predicted protein [Cloeon dipterum]|uniref:Major royal jelly protein n=1 Tax=Cloeon dipterum TaxID=197152 RepID=A0A8S1CBZ1_9INSE|nr:Hypothetical predicted protein [Cloeon dipterum]
MAVFGERLFVSLDPYRGIPATLAWLPTSDPSNTPPKLAPFPSWNLHEKDNCDSIQSAKGVETDTDGRLWVLDDGRGRCPGKLWLFDLLNNDTIERVHHFPPLVNSDNGRQLCDIVLDKTQDDYLAYITEYYSENIIVYSRKTDKSWEARQLYLGRYGSKELYSVSVSELKNEGGSAAVKLIGEWTENNPYRIVIDSANVLYTAFFNRNYLSKWNISEPFREQWFYDENGTLGSNWPFTFAVDPNGNLWMSERNATGGETRHKLLKAAVGERTYSFSTSPVPPPALTTPSVTTSPRRIPVSKTAMSILTTASTRNSSVLPLATLSPTYANEETTEVIKSLQTPTRKTGTGQPAVADLEEDYHKSQSLITVLIWLLVCCFSCLVLSGTVILWLTLRMRRRQISMDNNRAEINVFPDFPVYEDVGPEMSNEEARPENPAEPLYAEVHPEPLTSAGKPSEPEYDEVGSTEPENNYDDVGPGIAFRPPKESLPYLEVLPGSGENRL